MDQNDKATRSVGLNRPTMRDVAEAADVSFKTVSRIVNGEDGVRSELRERVRKAVSELGYHKDDRASNLRSATRTTRTIGFVQVDVANPFFASVFRGLEDVTRERGFVVLSGSSDGDPEREAALINTFVARRVDGLVVIPTPASTQILCAEMDRGTSVVCVDLLLNELEADVVLTDHHFGGQLATQHLIDHGHRRIAFLGDNVDVYSAAQRYEGYLHALKEAALPVEQPLISTGVGSPELAERELRRLLNLPCPPTAIFTAQNFVTIGAVRALHDLALHKSVAQVGFDDVELADVVEPGISVVPQDPRRLGREAGERLFKRLDGDTTPYSITKLTPQLIQRGSGEIPGPHSP